MTEYDPTADKRDEPDGYKDEETLRNMYHRENMTQSEIGDHFDKTSGTISHWMQKLGVETRSQSEYTQLRWDSKADHPEITKEILEELYIKKKLSVQKVADEIGCTRDKVSHRIDDYDEIERRSQSEAARIRKSRNPAPFLVDQFGYERWSTNVEGTHRVVSIHRLAAVAWFGWEDVIDCVIHHKNGHKRDNREENLEVIDNHSEHSKLHWEQGDVF